MTDYEPVSSTPSLQKLRELMRTANRHRLTFEVEEAAPFSELEIDVEIPPPSAPVLAKLRSMREAEALRHAERLAEIEIESREVELSLEHALEDRRRRHELEMNRDDPTIRRLRATLATSMSAVAVGITCVLGLVVSQDDTLLDAGRELVAALDETTDEAKGLLAETQGSLDRLERRAAEASLRSPPAVETETVTSIEPPAALPRAVVTHRPPKPAVEPPAAPLGFSCDPDASEGDPLACL